MIFQKSLFSITAMLLLSSTATFADTAACLQETKINNESTLSSLCFTGEAEDLIAACENIAHSDEFMTVTTEVLEACPTGAVGACTFSIDGKEQVSQYYDLSDQEKEKIPASCEMVGGTWSTP